jgi:DNA-binding MarR family transcriptional regulator
VKTSDIAKPAPAGSDDPEALELAAALRLVVMRLSRRLRQRADDGITPTLLSALATVDRGGPVTLGELAAAERVAPPSVTEIVSRLEEAGWVSRLVDPDDRRVTRVSVTPRGRRLLERSRARKAAYLARRLRTLGPADRATLGRAADLLQRLLEEEP